MLKGQSASSELLLYLRRTPHPVIVTIEDNRGLGFRGLGFKFRGLGFRV